MSMAQQARANAIPLEIKKDGLTQRQSGDWVLRVVIAAADMHQSIITAAMGTRFQIALVEINDDETPVDHKAIDRDKWRALGPAKQAGIRCGDPVFWAFLREHGHRGLKYRHITDEAKCAAVVRNICNVLTRSDLAKPGFSDQRILWFELDTKFQGWKAAENA